ncbi:MAG: transcription termination/antitermination protein NusG, partial [Planctomycetota bacterium]
MLEDPAQQPTDASTPGATQDVTPEADPDAAAPDVANPDAATPDVATGTETESAPAEPAAEAEAKPAEPALDGTPNQREDVLDEDDPITQEGMNWFVLRVASNKESSVQQTLLRKVQIESMAHLVGRILVPTEKTKTIKGGKQKIVETKLYPGYVFVEMRLEDDGRIPQDVFFLIKETTGVGDFIGTAGRPSPMAEHEIAKMLLDSRKPEDEPTIRMTFEKGEAVIIREGPFENYEGTVDELFPDKGQVRVLVTIFGRQAPVDLEEWQISKADE